MKKVLQFFFKRIRPLRFFCQNTPRAPRSPKRGALFFTPGTKKRFLASLLILAIGFSLLNCSEASQKKEWHQVPVAALKPLPELSWEELPDEEIPAFFEEALPFLQQSLSFGLLSEKEAAKPGLAMTRGRFLSLLCQTLHCPSRIKGTLPYLDIPKKSKLYPILLFALEQGILQLEIEAEGEPSSLLFYPDAPILRWEAAIWLVKAKQIDFHFFDENILYLLAQDPLILSLPKQGYQALAFCFLPENQFLRYRWSTHDEYRYCRPFSPVLNIEAAVALVHFLFPPLPTDEIMIAKRSSLQDIHNINQKDFSLLAPYIYCPAIGGRDSYGGYYPILIDFIPSPESGDLCYLDDGRAQITFHIRESLHWNDGTLITTEDVDSGFRFANQFLETQVPFEWLLGIKAVDTHTIIITWKRPFPGIERAFWLYPAKKTFPRLWKDYSHAAPFQIESIENQKIVCTENLYSVSGIPLSKRVQIHFFQNELPTNLSFDIILSGSLLQFDLDATHWVYSFPSMQWEHIDLKLPNDVLDDIDIRKKLAQAIDKNELNQIVWEGKAFPVETWFLPLHPVNRGKKTTQWILENSSEQELTEKMKPFSITLYFLLSDSNREQCASQIKKDWESQGLSVQVVPCQETEFFPLLMQPSPRDARAFLYSWIFTPHTTLYSILHSSAIPSFEKKNGQDNYTGFQDHQVDEYLEKMIREADPKKRADYLSRIQTMALQKFVTFPLYYIPQVVYLTKRLHGVQIPYSGIEVDWTVSNWYKSEEPKND